MKILIDTHIFLWALSEPGRIPAKRRAELESKANIIYVSAMSIAEIMIKASIGKIDIQFDPVAEAKRSGFEMLDFTGQHALHLGSLPFHHRDPFDRMLIAQGLTTGFAIMTDDVKFKPYGVHLV